jgi:hypothetical protein
MYFNVYGEKVSRKRYREMVQAGKNRRELISAGLTSRRDLMKLGLLTAGGMLVAKSGLSARASSQSTVNGGVNQLCVPNQPASPPTKGFVQPLTVMRQAVPVRSLTPAPTIAPNPGAGESRTDPHQIIGGIPFPPPVLYNFTQKAFSHSFSPSLPPQMIWGFDDGQGVMSPGPTYAARYGIGQLTRNHNALPPLSQNGGVGMPSVTTHLHNGHTASESDGNPLDFFEIGHFYDQHYPNVLAGFASTNEPNGDINESLSTLWYHDHRVDFTSQNTYKGLVGFYLLFNQFDTGNEETGFRLPSYPQFDIPLAFADKFFDDSGELAFDLFNLDGILGDKFLVNGTVQPFFQVQPRRYRFRLLDRARLASILTFSPTRVISARPIPSGSSPTTETYCPHLCKSAPSVSGQPSASTSSSTSANLRESQSFWKTGYCKLTVKDLCHHWALPLAKWNVQTRTGMSCLTSGPPAKAIFYCASTCRPSL